MSRHPLLAAVLALAAIGLAACGSAEPTEVAGTTSSDHVETTTRPTEDLTDAAPTEDETSASAEDATDHAVPAPTGAAPAVAPVTLAFDGREVPVATQCTGVDGAILATTEGEVTITLVREAGLALRYQAEGATVETGEVAVEGGTDSTTYRAVLASRQVDPVDVALLVMDDAAAALDAC